MAESLERLDTCSKSTGVGAVMAVWIARFGNRAMAGMFPVRTRGMVAGVVDSHGVNPSAKASFWELQK